MIGDFSKLPGFINIMVTTIFPIQLETLILYVMELGIILMGHSLIKEKF